MNRYGKVTQETLKFGSAAVLELIRPLEDRNRTAPFPYCGNRWECRSVGGGQNISFPLTVINTIMADSMQYVADKIESKGGDIREAVAETLKENFRVGKFSFLLFIYLFSYGMF